MFRTPRACAEPTLGMARMNRSLRVFALVLAASVLAPAQAQSLSPAWDAYRNRQRAGQQTVAPAPPERTAPVPGSAPSSYSSAAPTPYVPPPGPALRHRRDQNRSAGFVNAQGGRAWLVENVEQSNWNLNAGYRWRAGPFTQVGIEGGGGQVGSARWQRRGIIWETPKVEYWTLGASARFNFGWRNPWFGLVRTGAWVGEARYSNGYEDTVSGTYLGLGIGVDLNRHVNISLLYNGFFYLNDYDGDYVYTIDDINRADTVTLGLEARF